MSLLFGIYLVILLASQNVNAQEIEIDAADIKGKSGSEVEAIDAVLKFDDIILRSNKLNYDTHAGWINASGAVNLTDGRGNLLNTELLEYFPLLGVVTASGGVKFATDSGINLRSDSLNYEFENKVIKLDGDIQYQDLNNNVVSAKNINYYLNDKSGTASDITVSNNRSSGQFTASEINITGNNYEVFDASYTTCMLDDPAWLLQADVINLDENNIMTAQGAKLNFYNTPIFYWPKMSMTFSEERRSGFLAPRFIFRSGGEINAEIPYYLNLAPNYDAIYSARVINARGIYSQVKARSIFKNSYGDLHVGFIKDEVQERFRTFYVVNHYFTFPNNTHVDINAEWIADDNFGDNFFEGDNTAKRHYVKEVQFYQEHDNWQYGTHLLHHKTIKAEEDVVKRPFDTLPGFWLAWQDYIKENDFDFSFNIDNFTRGENDPLAGVRFNSNLAVNRTTWFGLTKLSAAAGVASSYYEVNDRNWIVPYASVEMSKKYINTQSINDFNFKQSIEPRIFLGLVTREDFSDVPLYDTNATEFSVIELYQVNSYVGKDRFEDSHLLAYGLDMHVWNENENLLVTRIAQRFRFEDSKIIIGNEQPPQSGFSNLVLETSFHPNSNSNYKGRLEWNPDVKQIDQFAIEAQFLPENLNAYSLRYTKNTTESKNQDDGQTSFHFYQGISRNFQVTGDLIYDLDEHQINKLYSGLRFLSDCRCWLADVYIEREPLATRDRTTYFFQLNLKGLGGFGSSKFDDSVARIKQKL